MNLFTVLIAAPTIIAAWIWFWPRSWFAFLQRLADNPRFTPFPPVDPFAFARSVPAFALALVMFVAIVFVLSLPFGGFNATPSSGAQLLLVLGAGLLPFVLWTTVLMVGWPRHLVPPNARSEADLEEQRYVADHPLVALAVIVVLVAVGAAEIWWKQVVH
ncbi:MAG: hypothetical protein E6I88_14105 [Chloroflexi bacterium]|nr:MAG: hypothetical protein E6I88_14105 [Chloroflexota bacterium]